MVMAQLEQVLGDETGAGSGLCVQFLLQPFGDHLVVVPVRHFEGALGLEEPAMQHRTELLPRNCPAAEQTKVEVQEN